MSKRAAAIIVTHNSKKVLGRCIRALKMQQMPPAQIVIVDSGSDDLRYLELAAKEKGVTILYEQNIGFSRANNRGLEAVANECDYVLFINPDLFLSENFIEKMFSCFSQSGSGTVLGGKLQGYDADADKPTGRFDSTGVFRTWYGRWYDRGQGEVDTDQYNESEKVPALCGALLCVPAEIIQKFEKKFFHEDFFLYKEDIELSLRLRKHGITLMYEPELTAFHCRGWEARRSEMDYRLRLLAAESEMKLYTYHPSAYVVFAWLKYLLVKVFKV